MRSADGRAISMIIPTLAPTPAAYSLRDGYINDAYKRRRS